MSIRKADAGASTRVNPNVRGRQDIPPKLRALVKAWAGKVLKGNNEDTGLEFNPPCSWYVNIHNATQQLGAEAATVYKHVKETTCDPYVSWSKPPVWRNPEDGSFVVVAAKWGQVPIYVFFDKNKHEVGRMDAYGWE